MEEPEPAPRISELDSIRGLALCGIIVANIVGITEMPKGQLYSGYGSRIYESIFGDRSFPIFATLFGLTFAIMLLTTSGQVSQPRMALLARLGYLIPFGVLHRFLQPDEVLLTYALVGIVVLLPATYLPRLAVLALGCIAIIAALVVTYGGNALTPGLFLLGLAAGQYGVYKNLGSHKRYIVLVFGFSSLLAVALNVVQIQSETVPQSRLSGIATLATATAYVSTLLLLLRTPARKPLSILEPFGRMALTNYITASLLIVIVDQWLHLENAPRYGVVILVGFAIISIQLAYSPLWLRYFRYGPLEWIWRCLTWWKIIPNRLR